MKHIPELPSDDSDAETCLDVPDHRFTDEDKGLEWPHAFYGAVASVVPTITTQNGTSTENHVETRVFFRRYTNLTMFVLLSTANAMQWIEYGIIAHIITDYYSVSYALVDWLSMIYMLSYVILIFPGSWFLNRYGLRVSVLIGAFGNAFGSWLKLLSTSEDRFWVTFVAQTIVGSSQVFILGIPSRLAAVWFGPDQVSTACAIGVSANQLGIAVGFVLPPFVVKMGSKEAVTVDLNFLFLLSAIANTIILTLLLIFFAERPPLPPSLAQAQAIEEARNTDFTATIKELLANPSFMLLVVAYGINVGVFYTLSTLLSQMVLAYHKDAQESTGTMGLLLVMSGLVGSVLYGYILDKFHHYKGTTLFVYLFCFLGMVLFTFTLADTEIWAMFLVAAILGFFMTGYLPLGLEFAAELTFPIAEGTTSGLLNLSVQVFGVAMTIGMGNVIYSLSIFWCNVMLSGFLLVGFLLTAITKADLKRQNAHKIGHYSRSETQTTVDIANRAVPV